MSIHRRSACTSIPPEITAGVCAVVNPLHWSWNQFRLPVPLEGPFWKTTKRFCTPAAPETVAVTVCHVSGAAGVQNLFVRSESSSDCPFFFFFNDTATTEIYTLSLHDALPIWNQFRLPVPPECRISS